MVQLTRFSNRGLKLWKNILFSIFLISLMLLGLNIQTLSTNTKNKHNQGPNNDLFIEVNNRIVVKSENPESTVVLYANRKIQATKDEVSDEACLYTPPKSNYSLRLHPKPYPLPPLDKQDYRKLIDLNDFEFTLLNTSYCKSYTFILVMITTAPKNFNRRQIIRQTWAKNDAKVKTVFMLGSVDDASLQESIETENKLYGDIVQGSFHDSYNNLTYKTIMSLKFVTYHCNTPTYIIKTDDDVFVNMPLLKNYFTNDLSPFGAENYLECLVMRNKPILRDRWSKWSVSEKEFPGEEYPTYCNGPYVFFSPDVLFKLYKEAQKHRYFFIEDVFLYGKVAGKFPEIKHSNIKDLTLSMYNGKTVSEGVFDGYNFLLGTLSMDHDEMLQFWHYVLSRPVRSSVNDYSILS